MPVMQFGNSGAPSILVKIEEVSPSGTGVVTFSSLGNYTHLRIVYSGRGDQSATSTAINLTFNSDTGSNYDGVRPDFFATGQYTAADQVAQTSAIIGVVPAATAPANYSTGGEILIHDYRGTTFFKSAFASAAGAVLAASTTNIHVRVFDAFWRNTGAITSITLTLASGNYVAGSKFTLYGMK